MGKASFKFDLPGEELFAPLGEEAAFGLKCWIRPWTCRLREEPEA